MQIRQVGNIFKYNFECIFPILLPPEVLNPSLHLIFLPLAAR